MVILGKFTRIEVAIGDGDGQPRMAGLSGRLRKDTPPDLPVLPTPGGMAWTVGLVDHAYNLSSTSRVWSTQHGSVFGELWITDGC